MQIHINYPLILPQLLLISPLVGFVSSAFLPNILKPSWAYKITRYSIFFNFAICTLLLKEYVFSFRTPPILIRLSTEGLKNIPIFMDLRLIFYLITSISCFLVTFGILFCYIQNTKKEVNEPYLRVFGSFVCLFTFLILLLITTYEGVFFVVSYKNFLFITIRENWIDFHYFPRIFLLFFCALRLRRKYLEYLYYHKK